MRVGDRRLRPDRPQAGGGAGPTTSWSATYDVARRATLGPAVDEPSTRCSRCEPDVVVVATTHDQLAELAIAALEAGAHVLVEKPAGIGVAQVDGDRARPRSARAGCVKVGFNHRFHPGHRARGRGGALRRARRDPAPARPLRPRRPARLRARVARRPGALRRRRADRPGHAPARPLATGCSARCRCTRALLRTAFWDMPVEDNAVVLLGERTRRPVGAAARLLDRVEEPVLARDLLPHGEAAGRRPRALLRPAAAHALPDEARARPARRRRRSTTRPRTARGRRNGCTSRRDRGRAIAFWATSTRRPTRGPASRPPTSHAADLGRHPHVQRGGQRRARLRAPVGGVRRAARRLGADLQRRPVDRPHRGADPRAARARPAREDAALLAPLRPARGDAGRAWRPPPATPSW